MTPEERALFERRCAERLELLNLNAQQAQHIARLYGMLAKEKT